jgi:hypothetical protein
LCLVSLKGVSYDTLFCFGSSPSGALRKLSGKFCLSITLKH